MNVGWLRYQRQPNFENLRIAHDKCNSLLFVLRAQSQMSFTALHECVGKRHVFNSSYVWFKTHSEHNLYDTFAIRERHS